jgi:hypothetical protein
MLGARLGAVLAVVVATQACTFESSPGPDDSTPRTALPTVDAQRAAVSDCRQVVTGQAQFPAGAVPPSTPPAARPPDPDQVPNSRVPDPLPVAEDGELLDTTTLPTSLTRPPGAQDRPEDPILFGPPITVHSTTWHQSEPEVAVNGPSMLTTWNLGAKVSTDAGRSFEYLNPNFDEPGAAFWGDQRAHYNARHDLWLWILMYHLDASGQNTIRLAWARGDADLAELRFQYVDLTGERVGFPGRYGLDQPLIATSDEFLYLSLNVFPSDGQSIKVAVVVRVALSDLVARDDGAPLDASCLVASPAPGVELKSAYPTRGAGDTMYLAAHQTTSRLAVWRWRDHEASPTVHHVEDIRQREDGTAYAVSFPQDKPYTCKRAGTGVADSSDWCRRERSTGVWVNDGRITTAWIHDGRLGFAWNASQSVYARYPFVWSVILDESKLDDCTRGQCIVAYPVIRDDGHAIQYAAIAPNATGGLGAVVLVGGGDVPFLSCRAAILDGYSEPQAGWDIVPDDIATSRGDLPQASSGDYLGIWADGGNAQTWTGACMSYAGGGRFDIRVARFGRRVDTP